MRTLLDAIRPLGCSALFLWVASAPVSSLHAAVESDVVGYTTIEMQAGKWYQIGCPFVELEDGQEQTLNSIFKEGFGGGDIAYVYDPTTSSYATPVYWSAISNTWGDAWGVPSNISLSKGQAVFIYKASVGKVVFKGRVDSTVVSQIGSEEARATWGQIACVYPKSMKVNEMSWSGFAGGDIMYVYDTESAQYLPPLYWSAVTQTWGDAFGTPSNLELATGQAMFIYKNSGLGFCSVPTEQNNK